MKVVTGDTRRIGFGVGTFASRSAVTAGNAVHRAAVAVRARAGELAAQALEAASEDIEFEDGHLHVAGAPEPRLSLAQLAVLANPLRYAYGRGAIEAAELARKVSSHGGRPLAEGTEPGLSARGFYSPRAGVFAFGMHAAVVEVDPDTCDLRVLRYVVVHDCGRVINPMVVTGQIHGGLAQGIGGAFYERIVYDEHGQLQNASFMDFLIPYATEVPDAELHHTVTPSPNNELGVKGVGEAGVIPVSATIANAVGDALGRPIDRMPLSPLALFELTTPAGEGATDLDGRA